MPSGSSRQGSGSRGVVAEIDRRLAALDDELRGYAELLEERERLRAARATVLGARSTGQISQEDVAGFLGEHPGSAPREIAAAFGVSANRVSAHLLRGKTSRFVSRDGGWYLREPKASKGGEGS
jgi:hypothetical protein